MQAESEEGLEIREASDFGQSGDYTTTSSPRTPESGSQPIAGTSGESELVQQLRAELEVQRLIAETALRDAEEARRTVDMYESENGDHHTLIQRVKELRAELQREKDERQKQRSQADVAKEQSRAWIESLQEKLKGFREEKKSWLAEAVELRSEVSELRTALAEQGRLLEQESARAFKLAAQRLEESPKFERVANFERRIDQLMSAQRLWADDIRKLTHLQEFVELKENEFQRLGQVLRGRIHEIELLSTAVREYEAEVADLKGKLATAEKALSSKALSPLAVEYAAEARAAADVLERQMEQLRKENEELQIRNEEQAEVLQELRLQLTSAQDSSRMLSSSDSLRLPQPRGSSGSRSRAASEAAATHAPHLTLQLSPAAAVPPVLSTPMLDGIVGPAFPNMQDETTPKE